MNNALSQEEIILMAKEAGGDDWGSFRDFMPEIERFAALVEAAKQERIAAMLDAEGWTYGAALVRGKVQA